MEVTYQELGNLVFYKFKYTFYRIASCTFITSAPAPPLSKILCIFLQKKCKSF